MTPLPYADLETLGEALFGPQWKAEVVRHLGISYRTLMRWQEASAPIPVEHVTVLRLLVRSRLAALESARKLLWSDRS